MLKIWNTPGVSLKSRPSLRHIHTPPTASGYLFGPTHRSGLFVSSAHRLGHNFQVPPPIRSEQIEQNREKAQKWPKNDQFWQIHFLNKRLFDSNYTPIDAEWQMEFFEITYRFLICSSLMQSTKNVSKKRRTNFADPMASERPFSLSPRNLTNLTSIDAEWQEKCFEITYMFLTGSGLV